MLSKYGYLNFWSNSTPSNCSQFFKGLCATVNILKPNCWIKSVNPGNTSLVNDPWCFEIPLAFKPTCINMDFDLQALSISDLIVIDNWNHQVLRSLFGNAFGVISDRLRNIDPVEPCRWVWFPKSHTLNIASSVYHFFNNSKSTSSHWLGWRKLWNIETTPRVKYFLWLVFWGYLLTTDFLQALNLGPNNLCALCGLALESAEHLLFLCSKAQLTWHHVGCMLPSHINITDNFTTRNWVLSSSTLAFSKAVFAAISWYIWKARCDIIFSWRQFKYQPDLFLGLSFC